MAQILRILLVSSLLIGYSVARPVENEEGKTLNYYFLILILVALYDRRAGELRRKISRLSDEERENLKQVVWRLLIDVT